jgi:ribonuclease P protein component
MGRTGRHPDEADVPAQEASPRQGAWVPRPDEELRRSSDARSATRPGPQEALGLSPDRGVDRPRLVMLTRPSDFAALQRDGTSRGSALVSVRARRTELPVARFGISTSKRIGGAVVRNRIRRRIREILRADAARLQPGWDVLIVARPQSALVDHGALAASVDALLVRSGVIDGGRA